MLKKITISKIWQRQIKIFWIFILGQIIATFYLFKLRGFDLSPIVLSDSFEYLNAAERFPNLFPYLCYSNRSSKKYINYVYEKF